MAIQSALSTQPLSLVAGDIRSQSGALAPKVVVYFGSTKYEHQDLAAAMQDAFPAALTIGCSTAGEIVSGRMLKQSVVALGLDGEEIEDAAVAVVETLSAGPRVAEAFQQFETHFQTPMQSLDLARFVGVVLVDGLCRSEEQLMDALGNLTDVIFVGGAAGDDLLFRRTFVSACGKAFPDAAVLLLLKVKKGFDIIKTQSFRALDKKLVATKVDEAQRRVDQFNHQPAAQAYADALGIPVAAIADFARQHPLGLMVAGEPYVRSPQQVQGESLVFYCNIKEGMETPPAGFHRHCRRHRKGPRRQGPRIGAHCRTPRLRLHSADPGIGARKPGRTLRRLVSRHSHRRVQHLRRGIHGPYQPDGHDAGFQITGRVPPAALKVANQQQKHLPAEVLCPKVRTP